jgi:hypothetical protein
LEGVVDLGTGNPSGLEASLSAAMATKPDDFRMHFLVPYLEIPASWQVGEAILEPAGVFREQLRATERSSWPPDSFFEPIDEPTWPTISVPIPNIGGADALPLARNMARDSLAVLDLYRRARLPHAPMDRQSFGLALDVLSAAEHRWITDSTGALAQTSAGRYGTLGQWTFTSDDIDAFRNDARFAYLDDALRAREPTDFEARTVSAIRTYALSRLMVRSALRVVLLATGIEALVGDPYEEGGSGTGGHQLARRAAFAGCGFGADIGRHGPGRAACDYLIATTYKELGKMLDARRARGEPAMCSFYWDVRRLSADRGHALHGARLDFPAEDVRKHEWVVRSVILSVLAWITEKGATRFGEYETAIEAVPRRS